MLQIGSAESPRNNPKILTQQHSTLFSLTDTNIQHRQKSKKHSNHTSTSRYILVQIDNTSPTSSLHRESNPLENLMKSVQRSHSHTPCPSLTKQEPSLQDYKDIFSIISLAVQLFTVNENDQYIRCPHASYL